MVKASSHFTNCISTVSCHTSVPGETLLPKYTGTYMSSRLDAVKGLRQIFT